MFKKRISRRSFLQATAGMAAALGTAGCASLSHSTIQKAAESDPPFLARLRVKNPASVRILQVTDLHFFGNRNLNAGGRLNGKTCDEIQTIIDMTRPDMLLVTGDLWPDNPIERTAEFMQQSIDFCAAFGVPWAFTWGNHDQLPDFSVGHRYITEAKQSLYRGADTNGAYAVELTDGKGRAVWQILCLNTEKDGLCAGPQSELKHVGTALNTRAGGQAPGRFAAFHIPINQYKEVWESGIARGFYAEPQCIEKEDGTALAMMKSFGVRACFCGHDHVNDYSGVLDGVELVYGRATGWGGYGGMTLTKGGKLIELDCGTGQYRWSSVLPNGTRWTPGPSERIDKSEEKRKADQLEKAAAGQPV
ncbi:MAG: metallophosphoesterase [Candidatus Hydrogenedentes bacterium]|nr:metallophosphoesterase [Candidatus Hydrogenedentota bacterium]